MLDRLLTFFLNPPGRLAALGQGLANVGGFVLLAGVIGKAALAMVAVAQRRVPGATPADLATLWPSLPTWWVPETFVGALPALTLVGIGWWLASYARRLRLYF